MRRLLRSVARRLAAVVAGVLVALVACEMALRVRQGDPIFPLVPPIPYVDNAVLYRPHPTRLYELRPGVDAVVGRRGIRIRTNAAGQRDDRDLPLDKPPDGLRVVVLGDSFTFGGKVELEETFARALERELAARTPSRRVETVNLAVPGYNTVQEMLSLKEVGLAYHPDVVVVAFVLNDGSGMQQLVPRERRLAGPVREVIKRFELVQLAYGLSKRVERSRAAERQVDDEGAILEGTPGWTAAEDALAEIGRMSAAAGARVLVAVWPLLADLDATYPFRDRHRLVVAACSRLGIGALDLLPTFEGRDPATLWAAANDHHPNPLALSLAAAAVARALAEEGMLPASVGARP